MIQGYNQIKSLNGILLVDKPKDSTSNAVVQRVKKTLNVKKLGHCGTLDPMATGLLILCIGKGTKISGVLTALDKEYEAVIQLGEERDTDDATGVKLHSSQKKVTKEELLEVLDEFTGIIEQVPPIYSAVKVKGKRAYRYAREGKSVDLNVRKINVYKSQLEAFEDNRFTIKFQCSKGTYIRSLARDIGRRLGTYGYLTELRRIRIGRFACEDQRCVGDLEEYSADQLVRQVISISEALYFVPPLSIVDSAYGKIAHGKSLTREDLKEPEKLEESMSSVYKLLFEQEVIALVDQDLSYINVFHYEYLPSPQ